MSRDEWLGLEEVLGLEEAAAMIGRSPVTLRWAIRHGSLRAKKVGRDWVTTVDELAAYEAWRWLRRRRAS